MPLPPTRDQTLHGQVRPINPDLSLSMISLPGEDLCCSSRLLGEVVQNVAPGLEGRWPTGRPDDVARAVAELDNYLDNIGWPGLWSCRSRLKRSGHVQAQVIYRCDVTR